jgi:hypothetical protein
MTPQQALMSDAHQNPAPRQIRHRRSQLQRRKIRCLVVDFAPSGGLVPAGQPGKMAK